MMAEVKIEGLETVIVELSKTFKANKELGLYAHTRLGAYCDPYVPKESGTLSNTRKTTAEYVEYKTPYAHYLYTGEVYGPNIPIRNAQGIITGWFSPPGKPKHPTGRPLTYSKELHPLATDHWEAAMMAERGDDLMDDIAQFATRKKVRQ